MTDLNDDLFHNSNPIASRFERMTSAWRYNGNFRFYVYLFGGVGGFILLFSLAMYNGTCLAEAHSSSYQKATQWAEESPAVRQILQTVMEDGVMSKCEYHDISDVRREYARQSWREHAQSIAQ